MTPADGRALRDNALTAVMDHDAPERVEYRERFNKTFDRLVRSGKQFCADDIHKRIGEPPTPHAAGAMMNACLRAWDGSVDITGWTRMKKPSSHARRTPLYQWVGSE